MSEGRVLLEVRGLQLRYRSGVQALCGVDVQVRGGELAVVLGSNGSGKSTLLRCIVRLLEPSEGEIRVGERDLSRLRGRALRDARCDVALVAQHANLVRRRSVLANVACGALGRRRDVLTSLGMLPREDLRFAHEQLRVVGLADRAAQSAGTLSGGQAQRVAIARSLALRQRFSSPTNRSRASIPTPRTTCSGCCGGSPIRGWRSSVCCINPSSRCATPIA
jgi:phosphonate transport system ATP-binding protein